MKQESLKVLREEAGDPTLLLEPPSPPRYEQWKRARQKPSGSYTSEASASIADKIESLVEESQQGTFVPHGRQDILTTAIGTPEHPGRVRAAGRGVGLKKFFGGPLHRPAGAIYTEEYLQAFRQGIIKEVTQSFNQQLDKILEKRMTNLSAKDSCSSAEVHEENVLRDLAALAMELDEGSAKIELEHEHHEHFYIDKKDLLHLCSGTEWLELSHLAVWCTYLHRLCITKGTGHLYGLLDPYHINGTIITGTNNREESIRQYIQKKLLTEPTKDCYLGPYLASSHWQFFILCPKSNLVVWMCSMHSKANGSISRPINAAMEGYNFMQGFRNKKPEWVIPVVPKQNNGYACGYYVMQNMLTIVSANIVSSWRETFKDKSPLEHAVMQNLQKTWSQFFINMYKAQPSDLVKSRQLRK